MRVSSQRCFAVSFMLATSVGPGGLLARSSIAAKSMKFSHGADGFVRALRQIRLVLPREKPVDEPFRFLAPHLGERDALRLTVFARTTADAAIEACARGFRR